MWQVYTRPTSASDFFAMVCRVLILLKVEIMTFESFHINLTNWCHHGPEISKLVFFTCPIWNMREVLVWCREKNFFCWFSRCRTFYGCHAPLPLQKFVSTLAQSLWKLESLNFGSRSLLGQLYIPHTRNLEFLGYLPYKFRLKEVKTWVWLSKFHPRTKLTALLVIIMGSRNQEKYSDFRNLTS
jgi:hypothetical protein